MVCMHKESNFDYEYIISDPQQVAYYVSRFEKFEEVCINSKLTWR